MSGAMHTPGPWEAYGYEVHDRRAEHDACGARVGDTPNAICTVHYIPHYIPSHADKRIANARLISAAPDLLAALESFVQVHEFQGHADRPWYQEAKRAIAKATGNPSA